MDAMSARGDVNTDAQPARSALDRGSARRLPAARIALVRFALVEVEESGEEAAPPTFEPTAPYLQFRR